MDAPHSVSRASDVSLHPRSFRHAALRAARLALVLALVAAAVPVLAAETMADVKRILDQDPARDNFRDPPGYRTGTLGELGAVEKAGSGPAPMLLVAGAGFGGDIFVPLTERWKERFTTYAVTLPGFGGTPAPPEPAEPTSFGEQTWTDGAFSGLEKLLANASADAGGAKVVVVGHWLVGTQLALRLAFAHPDRVAAVVLLAGSANRPLGHDPTKSVPLANRVKFVDTALGANWFRTVTRETWDDNNFLPAEYAAHPVLALRYWREAAQPPLHVWIRYLCEYLAQDVALSLDRLEAPTLLLTPGMEGVWAPPGNDYMDAFLRLSWQPVADQVPALHRRTLPGTRVILWAERPEVVDEAVTGFLDGVVPQPKSGS